jgi:signal transduction histidine kinase
VEIVQSAVEQLQSEHGDRFVLTAPEPIMGYFDGEALRRAVANLGANAVKYGTTERAVTITVRGEYGRAFIVVHNHGGYIPAEQQETLFRAFARLPQAQGSEKTGWGLGLAQVRGVAESHGGSIGIDSSPELGTSFTIDIPSDARPFQSSPTLAR